MGDTMKILIVGTALVAVLFASAANATISVSLVGPQNTLVFDDNTATNVYGTSSGSSHGYSWSTTDGAIFDTSISGLAAAPDASHYLSAGGNATVKFSARNSIDILWGTVDPYNTLTLSNGDSITGPQLASALSVLDDGSTGYWIKVSDDKVFNSFTATSSQKAFEFDLAAVPEPSTWALMLSGFAALGFAGYRSRKSAAAAA
jgi:hypothetical protein